MLLPVGTHNCLICEANGNCRLQDLAYFYKITKLRFKEKELSDIYPKEDQKEPRTANLPISVYMREYMDTSIRFPEIPFTSMLPEMNRLQRLQIIRKSGRTNSHGVSVMEAVSRALLKIMLNLQVGSG